MIALWALITETKITTHSLHGSEGRALLAKHNGVFGATAFHSRNARLGAMPVSRNWLSLNINLKLYKMKAKDLVKGKSYSVNSNPDKLVFSHLNEKHDSVLFEPKDETAYSTNGDGYIDFILSNDNDYHA